MEILGFKLKELKNQVTPQTKRKSTEERSSLRQIENDISDLILSNLIGSLFAEDKDFCLVLTNKQDEILKKNEGKLRLKSIALWIEVGDNKSKFFHNYPSYRGNLNSIWEIFDGNGVNSSSQDKIKDAP